MALKKPSRTATSGAPQPLAALRALTPEQAREIALGAAQSGLDKKALDIQIIDVTGKVDYADFLVLMTGQSDRHVASIARGVDEDLGRQGFRAISVEGLPQAEWVLIDFVDVVVHVFLDECRALYDLDGLWLDARRLDLPDAPKAL